MKMCPQRHCLMGFMFCNNKGTKKSTLSPLVSEHCDKKSGYGDRVTERRETSQQGHVSKARAEGGSVPARWVRGAEPVAGLESLAYVARAGFCAEEGPDGP